MQICCFGIASQQGISGIRILPEVLNLWLCMAQNDVLRRPLEAVLSNITYPDLGTVDVLFEQPRVVLTLRPHPSFLEYSGLLDYCIF